MQFRFVTRTGLAAAAAAFFASLAVARCAYAQDPPQRLPPERPSPPTWTTAQDTPLQARDQGVTPSAPAPSGAVTAPPAPDVAPTPPLLPAADRAPVPPSQAAPAEPPGDRAPVSPRTEPTGGYYNGLFFFRSDDDVFRLYVQGRVHVDYYSWFAPGVSQLTPDQALKSGWLLRRARLEMAGEFFQVWQWQLGAEFAPSSADDAAANTASSSCKVDPTSSLLTCSTRQNTVDAASVKPAPTDAFINFAPSPWANVQVGQFYLPFTLENRISDNTMPFLERSLAVRTLGAPLQREIGAMLWGESPDRSIYYAAGVFNGDGPNRPNADSRYDFAARFLARPFATRTSGPTKWAQIGASVHAGSRDPAQVGYDLPSLTTQEGYAFWKPTYTDSFGRLIHIIPSATQFAVAGDIYVPIGNFDFTGEFVYVDYDTREAVDGLQLSPFTERTGDFKGYAYYLQANYWILGDHDVIGYPSYQRPLHLDLKVPQKRPEHGLQALIRFEQLHVVYGGASRGGTVDAKTPNGDIDVTAVSLGVNYWATRHLRVSLNYGYYDFPGSEPTTASTTGAPVQTGSQRAVAPAQNLAKGTDDSARETAHEVHEVSMRVGVQF